MRGFWNSLQQLNNLEEVVVPQGYKLTAVTHPSGADTSLYALWDSEGGYVKTEKYTPAQITYDSVLGSYVPVHNAEEIEVKSGLIKNFEDICKQYIPEFELQSIQRYKNNVRLISNDCLKYPVVSGLESDLVASHLVLSFNPLHYTPNYNMDVMVNRLVCSNGMRLPHSTKKFRFNGMTSEAVTKALDNVNARLEKFKTLNSRLAEITVSPEDAYKYLTIGLNGTLDSDNLPVKMEEQRKEIVDIFKLWMNGDLDGKKSLGFDLPTQKHTGFGLLQAATEYHQHISPKEDKNKTQTENSNGVFQSTFSGYGNKQANRLFNTLVKTTEEMRLRIEPLVTF